MPGTTHTVYCIDTSALIDLKLRYPQRVFPSLWTELSELVSAGRMVAPVEVKNELMAKDDELWRWAKKQRKMFAKCTRSQLALVAQILREFPGLIDHRKRRPDADPFVIALALAEKQDDLFGGDFVVVTHEKPHPTGRPHIPDVCRHYDIQCVDLPELFAREGWRF